MGFPNNASMVTDAIVQHGQARSHPLSTLAAMDLTDGFSILDAPIPSPYHPGMMERMSLSAGANDAGRRLDRILRKFLPDLPLSSIHKMIRKGLIRINDGKSKPETLLEAGDRIEIPMFLWNAKDKSLPAGNMNHREEIIESMILEETEDLLFLNKPSGVLVHGGQGSLEAQVRRYLEPRLPPSLSFVPGPLHRLDRNTSGVIAFSKSIVGAQRFSESMQAGKIRKTYVAILQGCMGGNENWEDCIQRDEESRKSTATPFHRSQGSSAELMPWEDQQGQKASTSVYPILSTQDHSFVALRIATGRTHQIRSQAAARGYPLEGDVKYGALHLHGDFLAQRANYFLHAWRIEFHDSLMDIQAPIPEIYLQTLKKIFVLDKKEVYSLLRQSKI